MRKFLEDVIGPLRVPSHARYLNYFSGLLSGKIKMNSSPLYLKYVAIESPPSWMNYDSISTQSSEWRSFIKVYEGLNCVYTSGELFFILTANISTAVLSLHIYEMKSMIRIFQHIVPTDFLCHWTRNSEVMRHDVHDLRWMVVSCFSATTLNFTRNFSHYSYMASTKFNFHSEDLSCHYILLTISVQMMVQWNLRVALEMPWVVLFHIN